MSKRKIKKSKKKWMIYSGILIAIFIITFFSVNSILGGLIKEEVTKQLNSNPESIYHLKFEKLNVNIFTGSLTIKDLNIQPAEDLQKELSKEKIKDLIVADIKTFKIKNIKIFQFLRNSKIDISSIIIKNVLLDYYFKPGSKEASSDKTFAFEDIFSENFQGADISSIKISNTTLRFTNVLEMDVPVFEIDSLNILINDIVLNNETIKHHMPISFGDIKINTSQFSLNSSEFYAIKTEGVHINKQDSSIVIHGFALIPKYSKADYNKKITYNDDWFSVKTNKIKINHLNLSLLEEKNQIEIKSIEILNPDVEIYRDKRLPDAPFKYKALLVGVIKKIPMDIKIDTIQILDGKLTYEEQVDVSDEPGMVFFDPLFLTARNVTNNPEKIELNPDLKLIVKGKIMGQSFLNASFNFPLNRNDEFFTLSGTLNPMAASAFNPFLKNAMNVIIQEGKLTKTEFNIRANNDESVGSMILDYEGLGVEVLKSKNQTKKSGIMSWVANEVIRKNNTETHNKYRIGKIGFERRKDRFIVNYIWNSFKSGIISIVAPIADKNKKKEKQEANEEKKENRKKQKEKNQKN